VSKNFRNLADTAVYTDAKNIFLVGENGQGKTNFLEALYFSAYASSFRVAHDRELIRTGEKSCTVAAVLNGAVRNRIVTSIENNKKIINIDGKKIEDRKDILSIIPCIVFCHDDMLFVSGSLEERRWFFDQVQSLYDPLYVDDLRYYRRVLKNRNTVLKEYKDGSFNTSLLDALDQQLVHYGWNIMEKRSKSVQYFSHIFGPLYALMSGISGINIYWSPSWKRENEHVIIELLRKGRLKDLTVGTSLSGPHRDRYSFYKGTHEFTSQASTGQRRLLALLLRIAQAHCFSEITGVLPVLLLDDVLLELDPEKRKNFFNILPNYSQAFYTFLPGEQYEHYITNTLVYTVKNGTLTKN
jgi:DNA replication and repair protein RecF